MHIRQGRFIGPREEAKVSGGNPHSHREKHAKDPKSGFEPRTILLQGNPDTNCATEEPMVNTIRVILDFIIGFRRNIFPSLEVSYRFKFIYKLKHFFLTFNKVFLNHKSYFGGPWCCFYLHNASVKTVKLCPVVSGIKMSQSHAAMHFTAWCHFGLHLKLMALYVI